MNKIEEFWYCVASQDDLPLYKGQEISADVCENLINLVDTYKKIIASNSFSSPKDIILKIILDTPTIISDMRVLVGVSDKRLYLDLSYIVNVYSDKDHNRLVSEKREKLRKHDTQFFIRQLTNSVERKTLAKEISTYFINRGLIDILDTFSSLSLNQIKPIFNNLIAPKEIQQMQAKYRGHGAEQAFAKIVIACGLKIIPETKASDPMASKDPNVDLSKMSVVQKDTNNENCHSFDLIISDDNSQIRVLIQSLIHSSDPGQYGVNKSDETITIFKRIQAYNNKLNSNNPIYLLGSVDGVGFSENPNGTIVKMLDAFDDFFQMHTLFKIPVFLQKIGLINNVKGIAFDQSYFDDYAINHFVDTYLKPVGIQNLTGQSYDGHKVLEAGKATVIFE